MKIPFRIGHGYDVHALAAGLPLRLCGVDLQHEKGCVAHSDGDVAVHALCDALLGAAALGDIGLHFPDTSAEFKGIDSLLLLDRCVALLAEHGWQVGNVDVTIAMQRPKLRPHIDPMRPGGGGRGPCRGADPCGRVTYAHSRQIAAGEQTSAALLCAERVRRHS